MSTLLIAISGLIAFLVSMFYLRKTSDKQEKSYIVITTILSTLSLFSLMFIVSGRFAYIIFICSVVSLFVYQVFNKPIGVHSLPVQKLKVILSKVIVISLIVIIPWMFLIKNYSSLHPVMLVLISIVSSGILYVIYLRVNFDIFRYMWVMLMSVVFVFLFISVLFPDTNGIKYRDLRNLDQVFAREIIVENMFDSEVIQDDISNYQMLWISDVKVFGDKLYFLIFYFEGHYNAIIEVDLTSGDNVLLYHSFGENIYDYTFFDNTLIIATRDGFLSVVDGETSALSSISYYEDRLVNGIFSLDLDGLKYYTADVVYYLATMNDVTYAYNIDYVEDYDYINVNGIYQFDEIFMEKTNLIYDSDGHPIIVEGYYREYKVYHYDLLSEENNLGITDIYSSEYSDSLKGIFESENTIIVVDGKYQLLPIDFLEGYTRSNDSLYFYVNRNIPGVYRSSLGELRLSADAFAVFNNYILLSLIVILHKKEEYNF